MNDLRQISGLGSPAPSVLPTPALRVHPAHDPIGQWLRVLIFLYGYTALPDQGSGEEGRVGFRHRVYCTMIGGCLALAEEVWDILALAW